MLLNIFKMSAGDEIPLGPPLLKGEAGGFESPLFPQVAINKLHQRQKIRPTLLSDEVELLVGVP